ncbi:MAG: archaeosortase/exosortase family protein, partial [Cyanobium sp.]
MLSRFRPARQWRRLKGLFISRRNLWILLAALLAIHHLLTLLSQGGREGALNSLLAWGGAMVILVDQPMGWRPRPTRFGMVAGAALVVALLWHSFLASTLDVSSLLLPVVAGVALALLAVPVQKIVSFLPVLMILALPSLMGLLTSFIPTRELSLFTARITQVVLLLGNLPAEVRGNVVSLPEGAVEIAGSCSGVDMVVQLIGVGLIFALAFPMRHRWQNVVMVLAAPLLAILANAFRIALLACINSSSMPNKDWWFSFFHLMRGSWIFSLIAVLGFILIYGYW